MADLQSMTLRERMNTINGDNIDAYTFQEACNKWLSDNSPINGTAYSVNYNKYTPEEAFAIIRHKIDLRSETLNELVSELGSYYPIHRYTATEALNKRNSVLVPYSLNFDGSNDYVVISDTNDLSFGDSSDDSAFSISAWIKMDDATNFPILAKGVYNSTGEWLFMVDGSDKLKLELNDESVADTYERAIYNTALTSYEGAWVHVVCTYNGVGGTSANAGISLYINSASVATTLADNGTYVAMEDLAADVYIGRYDSTYADGKIDEVAIFNKALTQTEITNLYAADPQNAGDAVGITNLAGYWKLDEGSGVIARDQSITGDFIGSEKFVDNDFTADGSAWTLESSMTYDASNDLLSIDGTQSGWATALNVGTVPTSAKSYEVSFTTGTVTVSDDVIVRVGGSNTLWQTGVTADTTYSLIGESSTTGQIDIQFGVNTVCQIKNVSIKEAFGNQGNISGATWTVH